MRRCTSTAKTAPAVGLLLHKTDSNLQKLPAPAHFSRSLRPDISLRLIFQAKLMAFWLLFCPRLAEKGTDKGLRSKPTVYAAKRMETQ